MKKKLEADLISIAHRILKLKDRSELVQLHKETQKLYEKLSVLCFVEEHFSTIKPTVGLQQINQRIEQVFVTEKEETIIEKSNKEVKQITFVEKQTQTKDVVLKDNVLKSDVKINIDKKQTEKSVTLEDLLGDVQPYPIFVKAEEITSTKDSEEDDITKVEVEKSVITAKNIEKPIANSVTLNSRLKMGISFGLNDSIAFEKHLFGNSREDLNRVISQLNTFDNYNDAKDFIGNLVKPDYNNWVGKDEYEDRFMKLIESKFF